MPGYSNLKEVPELPDTLTSMNCAFQMASLIKAHELPEGITDMCAAFIDCDFTQGPDIPSTVTTLSGTFNNCTNLTGTLRINSSIVGNFDICFQGVTNPLTVQVPAGSITETSLRAVYGSTANITIETF